MPFHQLDKEETLLRPSGYAGRASYGLLVAMPSLTGRREHREKLTTEMWRNLYIVGISDFGNRDFLKNDDFLRKIGGVERVNPCF